MIKGGNEKTSQLLRPNLIAKLLVRKEKMAKANSQTSDNSDSDHTSPPTPVNWDDDDEYEVRLDR